MVLKSGKFIFFFHDALYYCVKHSNIDYEDEIYKILSSKAMLKRKMAKSRFGHKVHDLEYFKLETFAPTP